MLQSPFKEVKESLKVLQDLGVKLDLEIITQALYDLLKQE